MIVRPVTVLLLDDAAFEAVVVGDFNDDLFVKTLKVHEELLVMLGLIPEETTFVEIVRASTRVGVTGLYLLKTNNLDVRGTSATPLVLGTVVRQFGHTVDDHQFDLDRTSVSPEDDDWSFAVSALAEGSAQVVEEIFVDALSSSDLGELALQRRQ